NLAIGWCGSVFAAKSIINGLRSAIEKKTLSLDDLNRYFDSVGDDLWKLGVQFTGFIREDKGISSFCRNCSSFETSHFGVVSTLGSGADYAKRHFLDFQNNKKVEQTSGMNVLDRAIAVGATVAGAFLVHESATGQTLSNYFGAGYEIITQFGREFGKLKE